MQYPLFPPLWFKSQCYTVRECESDTLTRSVLYFLCRGVEVLCHCKKKKKKEAENYTADTVFLTVVTVVPSICPLFFFCSFVIAAFRAQCYVLTFTCCVSSGTQNVCQEAVADRPTSTCLTSGSRLSHISC